jgi:ABC-type transporter Mla subunit MlaD|tara:strand:- start:1407 stop:1811 length:405 start_codon:yes stop_codon:yes gene_type:complete
MSTIDEKLNEVLNIAEEVFEEKKEVAIVPSITPKNTDPDVDFETGRENLYKLLAKGNEAIDGILSLAKEGEHPRAYEVAGQLIKTVSEVSQDLLGLQEKMKKLKDVPNTGPKSVTNALFVGSTTELTKLLKKKD